MSSQFNYELDERQIRLMMQDAELDYSEAVWHKFEQMSGTQSKTNSSIGSYIPTINLSISRSVVVPVIFIVLIGGLSAMLFSFVDFKKKEAIQKEIPYVAPIKPTEQPKPILKSIAKQNPIATSSIITLPIIDTAATPTKSLATTPVVLQKEKEEQAKLIESKPQETISSNPVIEKKETEVIRPKKKRKIKAEPLPIINAIAPNLNEGASEPELDLK